MLRKLFKRESKELENTLSKNGLPFADIETAEEHYSKKNENLRDQLKDIENQHAELSLDYRANSLKDFENLYFNIFREKRQASKYSRHEFEHYSLYEGSIC